ncbi:MAG: HisA/HisF-related TIM barrel protein, partial [Acidobacteriota bacterium]
VAVNTAAVETPSLIDRLARRFGSQCVVLAMDAIQKGRQKWVVVVESGRRPTGQDPAAWAADAAGRGAGEILLTSWDRDGTRQGYDLDLIRSVRAAVDLPLIASGGACGTDHLEAALRAGADAVLAASMFHHGQETPRRLKDCLAGHGFKVRP